MLTFEKPPPGFLKSFLLLEIILQGKPILRTLVNLVKLFKSQHYFFDMVNGLYI